MCERSSICQRGGVGAGGGVEAGGGGGGRGGWRRGGGADDGGVAAARRLGRGERYLEVRHLEDLDRDAQQLLRLQVEHVGR